MRTFLPSLFALAAAMSPLAADAAPAAPETGRWITESGNLEVDIAPCGEALCGTVVRVLANRSMSRPESTMQAADSRSPLGMTLLSGFTPAGGGKWRGQIYNRENAQTYDCVLSLIGPDQLRVRPYKGLTLFGKTQIWRRADGSRP